MPDVLYAIPAWLIMLVVAVLVVVTNEAGFRFAQLDRSEKHVAGASPIIQAGVFTLVGLLLAFALSFALGRFDERRAVVVREANAIGTTFLRTDILDPKTASAMRALLREYIAARIAFARATVDENERAAAIKTSDLLQRKIWSLTMSTARANPRSTEIPLFVLTVNNMIDASAEETAALSAHIPSVLIIGLVVIILIAVAMMGYDFGKEQRHGLVSQILFAVTIAIVIGLILDLDRPQRGIIRVNLAPLQTLQENFKT
ncbi:MAG TPA: hypothetical protein VF741_09945 [Candidatus Aquilonibacter sp.]